MTSVIVILAGTVTSVVRTTTSHTDVSINNIIFSISASEMSKIDRHTGQQLLLSELKWTRGPASITISQSVAAKTTQTLWEPSTTESCSSIVLPQPTFSAPFRQANRNSVRTRSTAHDLQMFFRLLQQDFDLRFVHSDQKIAWLDKTETIGHGQTCSKEKLKVQSSDWRELSSKINPDAVYSFQKCLAERMNTRKRNTTKQLIP